MNDAERAAAERRAVDRFNRGVTSDRLNAIMRETADADAMKPTRAVSHTPLEDELLGALRGLFEHCAMVHKHWGDGSNQREADAAIEAGRAAIAKATGEVEA